MIGRVGSWIGAVAVRCLGARQLKRPSSGPTRDTHASTCMYSNCSPRTGSQPGTQDGISTLNLSLLCVSGPTSPPQDHSRSACPEDTFLHGQTISPPASLDRGNGAVNNFRLCDSLCPHSCWTACSFLRCLVRLSDREKAWPQVVHA